MQTMALVTVTFWVCTLIATPRRPLAGNEVAELVYARLLGRQQHLVLLALIATAAAFLLAVLALPARVDADLALRRQANLPCREQLRQFGSANAPVCYERRADGTLVQRQLQEDGSWLVTATDTAADP